MKTRDENLPKIDLIDAKNLHASVEFKGTDSLRSVSQEERKREASKPLYLARYE